VAFPVRHYPINRSDFRAAHLGTGAGVVQDAGTSEAPAAADGLLDGVATRSIRSDHPSPYRVAY